MAIKIIHPGCNLNTVKDGRGAIFSFVPDQPIQEWTFQFIKAGKLRGNHCHPEFDERSRSSTGRALKSRKT